MILKITNDTFSLIKNGVYQFGLSDYPLVQDWEWNGILAFLCYEKAQGQQVEIVCENTELLALIIDTAHKLDGTEYFPPVVAAIEEYVYHATNVNAAQKILSGNRLLAATKVCGKTGEEIVLDRQESGWVDPADFYEYVMFGWGTHLVGDYVVLSENFPCQEDLAKGNFDAGVRFYFRYHDMIQHQGHVFDGYHPLKVKDEVVLSDYLYACIVPEQYKEQIENYVPAGLASRVFYLTQRGLDLQEWNDKVVEFLMKNEV